MEITPLHLKFIATVVCLPISSLTLLYALVSWLKHGRRVDWQPVQGTIVYSDVAKDIRSSRSHLRYENFFSDMTYFQTVEYSYRVNGKEYVNDVYRRGDSKMSVLTREAAQEARLQFKTGSPITVYYDPQSPANSVLDPNYEEHSFLFAVSLLTGAIGGILWLLATYMSLL